MDLHVFFLPFLSPGHMIPLVDIAKLFAARGVRSTVVTTPSNAPLIQPAISSSPHLPIHLLTLPFPSSVADNCVNLPTPDLSTEFMAAIATLREPLDRLVSEHSPDCIISDIFYPWTADLASAHGIPRIGFNVTGAFASNVMRIISTTLRPGADDEDGPIVVPGIPDQVEIFKSQLPESSTKPGKLNIEIFKAQRLTMGTVMNTFLDLEPGYTEALSKKAWFVGPVALCDKGAASAAARGGKQHRNYDLCMDWLGGKKPGSVLYVCFGSLGKLTRAQLYEAATGLGDCDHPFIWVVKNDAEVGELLPEGFEDRIKEGKGLIVRGWAPQVAVLSHVAVGGFLTHCGWNSCLEGVTAGVPMVTWPQFAEQFLNERLLVDVLRIGVSVGARVNSGTEERRTLVKAEAVTRAANEVMGGGEEAEGRRRRVKELAEMAVKAMEEGGSSYRDLSSMIETLVNEKKKKRAGEGLNGKV